MAAKRNATLNISVTHHIGRYGHGMGYGAVGGSATTAHAECACRIQDA